MTFWGIGETVRVHFSGMIALFAVLIPFFLSLVRARGARGVEAAGSGASSLSRIGILIQMVGFAAVGFGPVTMQMGWPEAPRALLAALAALFSLLAYLLFHRSRLALAQNWSIVARTRGDHQLVTTGPYALVRHPIYVALFGWMLAMAAAMGHLAALKIAVPLYVVGMLIRTREEERLLGALFGADYDAYAARVKRFIPFLV